MRRIRPKLLAAAVATTLITVVLPSAPATAAGPNLAAGKTFSASSVADVYGAGNAGDGNANTYWESNNNAFPQWLQVDLGASVSVNQAVLKLPPATAWQTRTQTLSVQGSTTGSNFTELKAGAGYVFNPSSGNTVTIDFGATPTRYLRLNVTGNTGWPAGQISELEVYGPATGDTQAPSAPSGLAYTQPAAGQIRLAWAASTDNVAVTGYNVYANGALKTTVTGLNYTDSQPAGATVSYHVKARDAAGNESAASNTVTRTGTVTDGTNLAVGKPISASSSIFTFVAANANDNDTATYWEGNGYPATLTVALGANASTSSVVVKLNPATAWGTRTQTFSIQGREQSATGFTTLVPSATYTFNPASGNAVSIRSARPPRTSASASPPTPARPAARSPSSRSSAARPRTRT